MSWSGIEVGMEYEAAKQALAAGKIAFEEKSLPKDGTRMIKPARDGWSSNTIYFSRQASQDVVSQLTFIQENATQKTASAAVSALEKKLGPATEKSGPRAMDSATEVVHLWKSPKTTLKLTVRIYKDGTMSVFENWGKP